jgi:hypothetical protein
MNTTHTNNTNEARLTPSKNPWSLTKIKPTAPSAQATPTQNPRKAR